MSVPKRDRSGEYRRKKERCLLLHICFRCGNPLDTPNSSWLCAGCLDQARKKDRACLLRRKASGLCLKKGCPNSPNPDSTYCAEHKELFRSYQADYRTEHKARGVCITCGGPLAPGQISCQKCNQRASIATMERYTTNIAAGVCAFCGDELDLSTFRCNRCHQSHRDQWTKNRQLVIAKYGGQCVCCHESIFEFLELDHVNNNGKEHRLEIGRDICGWAIRNQFPTDLQILCANCNRGKAKFGVCPHLTEPGLSHNKKQRRLRRRRLEVIEHYGGKCVCCGELNWAFLEFDHINNDGKQHRQEIGGQHFPSWLIRNNFPDCIQLLCCNCNKAKGLFRVCPHASNLSIVRSIV